MRVVGAAELFGRLDNQLPGWYARRDLSTQEAAVVLGLDDSTIRQQAGSGAIKGRRSRNGWRFSIRDLADYILAGKWRGSVSVARWTESEIVELMTTGACASRSKNAAKLMKWRMKNATDPNHRSST